MAQVKKNIFITGVSQGLGFALTQTFLEENFNVWGISRQKPKFSLMDNKSALCECTGKFNFCKIDLSCLENISHNIENFFLNITEIDLVILNAGALNQIKDLAETPVFEIQRLMDIHLYANKIILDTLFRTNKKIEKVLSISTGAAINGNRGWNAYALSKCSQNMLIKMYAQERPETHFISLAPGLVNTAMQDCIAHSEADARFAKIIELKAKHANGEIPSPAEVSLTIISKLKMIFKQPSGSFVDMRNI